MKKIKILLCLLLASTMGVRAQVIPVVNTNVAVPMAAATNGAQLIALLGGATNYSVTIATNSGPSFIDTNGSLIISWINTNGASGGGGSLPSYAITNFSAQKVVLTNSLQVSNATFTAGVTISNGTLKASSHISGLDITDIAGDVVGSGQFTDVAGDSVGYGAFTDAFGDNMMNGAVMAVKQLVIGSGNNATGSPSVAMGYGATAAYNNSFSWSDNGGEPQPGNDQFFVNATSGIGLSGAFLTDNGAQVLTNGASGSSLTGITAVQVGSPTTNQLFAYDGGIILWHTNLTFTYGSNSYYFPNSKSACLDEIDGLFGSINSSIWLQADGNADYRILQLGNVLTNRYKITAAGMGSTTITYWGTTNGSSAANVMTNMARFSINQNVLTLTNCTMIVWSPWPGGSNNLLPSAFNNLTLEDVAFRAATNFPFILTAQAGIGFYAQRVAWMGPDPITNADLNYWSYTQPAVIGNVCAIITPVLLYDCTFWELADGFDDWGNNWFRCSSPICEDVGDGSAHNGNVYPNTNQFSRGYTIHLENPVYQVSIEAYSCYFDYSDVWDEHTGSGGSINIAIGGQGSTHGMLYDQSAWGGLNYNIIDGVGTPVTAIGITNGTYYFVTNSPYSPVFQELRPAGGQQLNGTAPYQFGYGPVTNDASFSLPHHLNGGWYFWQGPAQGLEVDGTDLGSDGSAAFASGLITLQTNGTLTASNIMTTGAGKFTGNGNGLTNLNLSSLGTSLPSNVITNHMPSDVQLGGNVYLTNNGGQFNISNVNNGLTFSITENNGAVYASEGQIVLGSSGGITAVSIAANGAGLTSIGSNSITSINANQIAGQIAPTNIGVLNLTNLPPGTLTNGSALAAGNLTGTEPLAIVNPAVVTNFQPSVLLGEGLTVSNGFSHATADIYMVNIHSGGSTSATNQISSGPLGITLYDFMGNSQSLTASNITANGLISGNGFGVTNLPATVFVNPNYSNAIFYVGSNTLYLQDQVQNLSAVSTSAHTLLKDTGNATNGYSDMFQDNSAYLNSAAGTLDASNDAGFELRETNSGIIAALWLHNWNTNGPIRLATTGATGPVTNLTLWGGNGTPATASNVFNGTIFGNGGGLTNLQAVSAVTNSTPNALGYVYTTNLGIVTSWLCTNALPFGSGGGSSTTNFGPLTANQIIVTNGVVLTNSATLYVAGTFTNVGNVGIGGTLTAPGNASISTSGTLTTGAINSGGIKATTMSASSSGTLTASAGNYQYFGGQSFVEACGNGTIEGTYAIDCALSTSGGIGVALFATNANTMYVPLIISSNNPPFGVSNNAACLWNNGTNLILRTSSSGSTNYYGDLPFPHIETGTTNATALTVFTAIFTVPFSDTNYVATETGNGIALASSYVSFKTTNSCVFNMTVATGNIDWICTHR